MQSVRIFTDGASRGNPGPGGWGAIVANETSVTELGGREDVTTNNRMELLAVISALEFLSTLETSNLSLVTIYTDSSYVLKGGSIWLSDWKQNNWKTKAKGDVLNKDLWIRLDDVLHAKKLTWKLLPGHSGIPANERCDEIATAFADKRNISLYKGPIDRYNVDLSKTEAVATKKKKSSGSSAKAFSYVSLVKGHIQTHQTWDECERRVKGVSGARFKKALSVSDERNLIALWNKESKQ